MERAGLVSAIDHGKTTILHHPPPPRKAVTCHVQRSHAPSHKWVITRVDEHALFSLYAVGYRQYFWMQDGLILKTALNGLAMPMWQGAMARAERI